jgi:hypothetical protein
LHAEPHLQDELQVTTSQSSQPDDPFVAPGLQTPSPPQLPQVGQVHSLVHVRDLVPQFPQSALAFSPGLQTPSPVQVAGAQVPSARQTRTLSPHLPQVPTIS